MTLQVIHEFTTESRCPMDPAVVDRYEVRMFITTVVPVETILEFCAQFRSEAVFQEKLTQLLAERFDAFVTTVGTHSGVKTTCSA